MLEVSGLTPWDGEWMWSSETPRSRSSVGCAGPSGAGLARWSSTSSVPRSFFGGGMTRSTRSVIDGHPSAPSTLSASDRLLDGRRSGRRLPSAHRAWARSSQTRNWFHSGSSQGPLPRDSRVGSGPGQDRNLAIPASSMPPWWSDRCPRIWAWRHRIVVTGFANGCQFPEAFSLEASPADPAAGACRAGAGPRGDVRQSRRLSDPSDPSDCRRLLRAPPHERCRLPLPWPPRRAHGIAAWRLAPFASPAREIEAPPRGDTRLDASCRGHAARACRWIRVRNRLVDERDMSDNMARSWSRLGRSHHG